MNSQLGGFIRAGSRAQTCVQEAGGYSKITNPETGRKVNIFGKKGQQILRNYINQLGGHNGPCAMSAKGRCAKASKADGKCEVSPTGRCRKIQSAKVTTKKAAPKKVAAPKKKAAPKKVAAPKKKASPKKVAAPKKKAAPKKVATPKKRAAPKRARKPMSASKDVTRKGKMVNIVKTKKHGAVARLSAGEYYRAHGNDSALGDRCDIRKNDEYRCLLKRSNGTAYWAKKSKSGKGQEICGDWSSQCQEREFA